MCGAVHFSGDSSWFLAVSVVFRPFQWFPVPLGQWSGRFGPFLAISVIFGSLWPLAGPLWSVLPVSAHFCPMRRVLVSAHSPNPHNVDAYPLRVHLLWGAGHTQAPRRIFHFQSGVVPLARCLVLRLGGPNPNLGGPHCTETNLYPLRNPWHQVQHMGCPEQIWCSVLPPPPCPSGFRNQTQRAPVGTG